MIYKKFALDITLLTILFPLWFAAVILFYILNILLNGTPGFYKSERLVGSTDSGASLMTIYKFRTMKKNIDTIVNRDSIPVHDTIFLNLPIDKNIYTNFGRYIELFGITEIPQFFYIFSRKLSIVGSRPLPINVYSKLITKYKNAPNRFNYLSGLTGLPQLIGKNNLSDKERLDIESMYNNWLNDRYKIFIDIKILLYTVLIVLKLKKPLSVESAMSLLK